MAVIDTTRLAPVQGFGKVFKAFVATSASLKAWNDKRITRNALGRLSARELDDIGLARCDIENI